MIQDQRTKCQCGKNRICEKICEVTLLKLDPVCSQFGRCWCWCCGSCCPAAAVAAAAVVGTPASSSENSATASPSAGSWRVAALRTKPVPRQEVTPAPLHQPHFRALWTSFLRLGSWRGVRRKKLVHGVRVKRRISRFRAASISRCI